MSAFESDRPRRRLPLFLILLVLVVVGIAAAAFMFRARLESQPPQVTLTPDVDVMGTAPLEITVSDPGSGLRSVTATLSAGGTEHTLAAEQYAQPVPQKKIAVALAQIKGLKEGPAVLRVTARDASFFNWGKGNETTVQKNITIDVTPPTLELIADDRYINFGGVGALVYRPSADTVKSGVKMGKYFFPGFPGLVKDHPERWFVLFSHTYDTPPQERPVLVATDKAGNTREMRIAYELKDVRYKKSTIALSDNFLENKVRPLADDAAMKQAGPKELFIGVNEKVRKENEDKIAEVTSKATPQIQWSGAFAQLSNSKVEANFADLRTYTYNGEGISTRYHLGYDLSVTKHYPIEAANSGTVVFTGDLGLYGNAVILDHGLGLFTLYGHMSSIDVKVGDKVEKRQAIGHTGETGLAAGDHLHYGVFLDGVAILPVEWWDAKWINDNVTPKLAGGTGDEIAQAQRPARVTKIKHKRGR